RPDRRDRARPALPRAVRRHPADTVDDAAAQLALPPVGGGGAPRARLPPAVRQRRQEDRPVRRRQGDALEEPLARAGSIRARRRPRTPRAATRPEHEGSRIRSQAARSADAQVPPRRRRLGEARRRADLLRGRREGSRQGLSRSVVEPFPPPQAIEFIETNALVGVTKCPSTFQSLSLLS